MSGHQTDHEAEDAIDEVLAEFARAKPVQDAHEPFAPHLGEEKHRQQVRVLVTSGLLGMISAVIAGIFVLLGLGRFQDAKDVAQMLFTPLLTAAAPIFGFYFAQRS